MKYKLYEVGGRIRDEILGLQSKDIDYTVVIENSEDYDTMGAAFNDFVKKIKDEGYEVFLETEDMLTVRALFPKDHVHSGVADFVIARKEIGYIKGTRNPICELGTLEDDLARRDFSVNCIAKDEQGDLIDPFNGAKDIAIGLIRTPGDPMNSFKDDPLRILRAMRFCITKNFTLSESVRNAIKELSIHNLEKTVSQERIKDEVNKCFRHNTLDTIKYLNYFEKDLNYPILSCIFGPDSDLWINVTNKK